MKVLIIGGAGYLGTPLTQLFVSNRNPVICVDKLDHSNYDTIKEKFELSKEFTKQFTDGKGEFIFVEDNIKNIDDYLPNFTGIERILYMASPRLLELDKADTISQELSTLRWVIEKVKNECDPNFLFYFFSSCSVYGRQENFTNPFKEEANTQITTRYSELKIKSEQLLKKEDKNRFKIFRLSTLYGLSNPMRNDILINNLVDDIKQGKQLEIYDKDAKRPHLHIDNAVDIIHNFVCSGFEGQILNIGFNEYNKTKKEIVEEIEKVIDKKLDVKYVDAKDSRDYTVDFSKMHKYEDKVYREDQKKEYRHGIYDLWIDRVNVSVEEYDSILQSPRPSLSSKTWYLKEEGKISYPKVYGEWNMFEEDGVFFGKHNFIGMATPVDDPRYINVLSPNQTRGKKHIHLVPVYDPQFFEKNIKIGYKCVTKKYLSDVREGRCKIVFLLSLEGYSGETGNRDLEIISQWNKESEIPDENVYYICGNLKINELLKRKGLKFKGIPASIFDIWINPLHMPPETCPFNPHETKMLFLSYNRNMDRNHRIGLCSRLLREDLLENGKVSIGDFDMQTADLSKYPNATELKKIVPIEIDRTLKYNLANDVSHDDFHQTFVSLVTESLSDSNVLFLSEKIWKPIYMGHPFIVLGNPGTLKYLKKLGFQTYDRWWDETYDDEEDLEKRIDKIVFILKRLSEKNHEDLIKVREEMRDINIKNRELFKKIVSGKYEFPNNEYNPQKYMIKILAEIQSSFI